MNIQGRRKKEEMQRIKNLRTAAQHQNEKVTQNVFSVMVVMI